MSYICLDTDHTIWYAVNIEETFSRSIKRDVEHKYGQDIAIKIIFLKKTENN